MNNVIETDKNVPKKHVNMDSIDIQLGIQNREENFYSANSKIAPNSQIKTNIDKKPDVVKKPKKELTAKETSQNILDALNDLFKSPTNTKDKKAPQDQLFQNKGKEPSTKVTPDIFGGNIIDLAPKNNEKATIGDNEMFKKVLREFEMNNIYNEKRAQAYNVNNSIIHEGKNININQQNMLINSSKISKSSNSKDPEKNSGDDGSKSESSNINIYNIQNNINSFSIYDENLNIEEIANAFLNKELSRANLHWLISNKDIKMEQKIGFGGTSEVFKATYRGTEVAVKKLRISEVQEENLKEFKREV